MVSQVECVVECSKADAAVEMQGLYEKFVVPSYRRTLTLTRGEGSYVWDTSGKRYLDMGGGIAVNSLGHAHPAILSTLQKQASRLIHVSNLYYNEPQALLAKKLVELTGPGKVFFCNSGAEANEALYKLARRVGHDQGRYEVITTINSFHGRTLAGIAATGQEKVKKSFEPLMPGFIHVPYNDLAAAEKAIGPKTAAILVEGVQGEGGIIPATPEYLLGLRELTRKHGILLLMDSVQCGFFRSGYFQSYERILENHPGGKDFLPDGISMAKALGGGFPIGAVWIGQPYQDVFQPGSHGTTFGGTPLACAVALEVISVIEREKLVDNIRRQGDRLIAGLKNLSGRENFVSVRGFGAIVGFQTKIDPLILTPQLAGEGLLVIPSGNNSVRFLPPYNITAQQIDEALAIVQKVI